MGLSSGSDLSPPPGWSCLGGFWQRAQMGGQMDQWVDGWMECWPDEWGMGGQTGRWAGWLDRRTERRPDSPSLPLLPLPRHNDLPWQLLEKFNNQLRLPEANLTLLNGTHTNIPKLHRGHVGGQVGW